MTSATAFLLAGLALSLAGDAALIFLRKRLDLALAAFLIAHLGFALSFRAGTLPRFAVQPLFPLVLVAAIVLRTLLPRLGKWKYPVLLYVLVITVMAGFAAGRFIQWGGAKPLAAFAGAMLLLGANGLLGFDRFVKPAPQAAWAVPAAFLAAQAVLALSI